MNRFTERLVFVLLVVAVAGGVGWWWWNSRKAPPPPPTEQAQQQPAAPEQKPEPQHPIAPPEPAKPLPPLAESDGALREELTTLYGAKAVQDFFNLQGFVRRVVATIDNLPRNEVAMKIWPLKAPAGRFTVSGSGSETTIASNNAARYTPYVRLAEAVDPKTLVATYARMYPLFQQAYQELGYPQGYFNDRLIEVVDHLLATPEVKGPIKLTQPKVVYHFADADLQGRSAGQKLLLRMGPEHAARIKVLLQEVRRELTQLSQAAAPAATPKQ
jgi:hypothetical protein